MTRERSFENEGDSKEKKKGNIYVFHIFPMKIKKSGKI